MSETQRTESASPVWVNANDALAARLPIQRPRTTGLGASPSPSPCPSGGQRGVGVVATDDRGIGLVDGRETITGPTKTAPRRVNDRGHGIGTEVQMQTERTALIQQVVKAVEALKPNEAILLPGEAIVARSEAGTLRFANNWFRPVWRRVDGLQGAREHTEMLLTGNPYYVGHDRRELVLALKEGACPVQNVGRRNFYVVRRVA